jgi:hypothetical protein
MKKTLRSGSGIQDKTSRIRNIGVEFTGVLVRQKTNKILNFKSIITCHFYIQESASFWLAVGVICSAAGTLHTRIVDAR